MTIAEEFTSRGFEVTEDDLRGFIREALNRYPAPNSTALTAPEEDLLDRSGLPADDDAGPSAAQSAVRTATRLIVGSYTPEQAADVLGVSPSRVSHRAAARELYQVSVGRRRYLPRWQFHQGAALPWLGLVLRALPEELHPISVEGFFTTPSPDLGGMTPAAWLLDGGDPAPVAFEAAGLDRW